MGTSRRELGVGLRTRVRNRNARKAGPTSQPITSGKEGSKPLTRSNTTVARLLMFSLLDSRRKPVPALRATTTDPAGGPASGDDAEAGELSEAPAAAAAE